MNKKLTCTTALSASVLVLVLASAAPAAATTSTNEIAGTTRAAFVAAATEQGYGREAAAAWGNITAMASIPVADERSGGGRLVASTDPARATYRSGSCTRTVKNLFGGLLMQLTVRKTWRVVSSREVRPHSASYSTRSGFLWNFDGLAGSQEYYTKVGSLPKGMHTSKRHARFTHPIPPPEARTIWAEVNGTTISYGCRYGG